jgi:type II secretory pathway pseudopilin PulG
VNALRAFTLLELLLVVGIIIFLSVLTIPALTSRKSGDDMNKAASTIKETLDKARTYAQANNTFAWVGFFEEDGSQPPGNAVAGNGRLVMSVVASKDGTLIYDTSAPGTNIDPTRLTQVVNLVKIDNAHLPLLQVGSGTGDTFDTRPALQNDPFGVGYNDSRFGEFNLSPSAPTTDSSYPFQYPVGNPAPSVQYTFKKTLRFAPTGENRINSTYDVRRVVEIGLIQTHGSAVPTPNAGVYPGNVVAVQIGGFDSDVKIYKK